MDQDKIASLKDAAGEELTAIVDELAAKHEDLAVVHTAGGVVLFRNPTAAEYQRHLDYLMADKTRAKAMEVLARSCVVHPSKQAFDALLARWPATPIVCADALTRLAGGAGGEYEKK